MPLTTVARDDNSPSTAAVPPVIVTEIDFLASTPELSFNSKIAFAEPDFSGSAAPIRPVSVQEHTGTTPFPAPQVICWVTVWPFTPFCSTHAVSETPVSFEAVILVREIVKVCLSPFIFNVELAKDALPIESFEAAETDCSTTGSTETGSGSLVTSGVMTGAGCSIDSTGARGEERVGCGVSTTSCCVSRV